MSEQEDEVYRNVSIKKDMTPLEREEMRDLLSKRGKMKKNSDEKGKIEKWVVRTIVNVYRRAGTQSQEDVADRGRAGVNVSNNLTSM